jgi:hypothetical protein
MLAGKPEERGHMEDLALYGRIILKQIFDKWGWVALGWIYVF